MYTGEIGRLTERAIASILDDPIGVSPIVQLELTHFHEIGRITLSGAEIVGELRERINPMTPDATLDSVDTILDHCPLAVS